MSITGAGRSLGNVKIFKPRSTDIRLMRTSHYCGQFALSLGKESPYIFSKFNPPDTDTFYTPTMSVLMGFDFTECVQELRKTEFCEGHLNYSCPLTRVSVTRVFVTRVFVTRVFVRTHPYLGVPVVQSHKFSRYGATTVN